MENFRNFNKNIFKNAMKENLNFKEIEDDSSNNLPKGVNEEELAQLRSVAIDQFKTNKIAYKRLKNINRLKFFFNYFVPLATLAVSSGFILKTSRDEKIVPLYNIEQTMISDDKMVQIIDEENYAVTDFEPFDENEEFIKCSSTNTAIQYQVKNGTHSVIVTIDVDSEGKMSIGEALSGNFYDRNADVFKGVTTSDIETKYQEVVDDIGDFIQESNLGSPYKGEIKDLLEQERTVVITTVVEYIENGNIHVIEPVSSNNSDIAFYEALDVIGIVIAMIILNAIGLGKTFTLDSNLNGELELSSRKYPLIPFKTLKNQKTLCLRAEGNRRRRVKELASRYLTEDSQKYFDI